ncbi:outer membrane protein assembly factor BamB family protein [Neorhodopirellula pilleata]|uniref:Outer membrane biogenesis protein BamB n=1 Tax=Neorhodopirellula pilleata TaxID=2714738 RepID=A0A5C6AU18_9BACT|nr:PQQ-binding-like beta-propeller repeat protein [Neorhodopirellula pilleata]TWU03485.1 outer membrane biogenesis protein BamB [Neorhodopirellula pilleata]
MTKSRLIALLLLFTGMSTGFVNAAETDWPQWRGPQRDGHAAPQLLAQSWPTDGPALKWESSQMGRGYSSMSIVDGRLFTMGADEQNCFAVCLDSQTGKSLWKTNVSRAGANGDYNVGWGAGPRSTPTIDGDQVFVLSDVGTVAVLKKDSGDVLWSVDLVKEYGGQIPKWGYSESILIDGDRVIVCPGGANFMVGLDRQSGRLVWQSRGYDAPSHYVSVIKGNFGGVNYYVTASNKGVVAFDCQNGNKLFENPTTGNDVATIPTPIVTGDLVYHTSDYGAGNVLLKLTASGNTLRADQVYHLDGKTMMNHHGGVVLVDQVIYGFTKANGGTWMAQDLPSGDTLWEEKLRGNKSGSIAYADGRLYCYNDGDGTVMLVEPSRKGFLNKGTLTLPKQTSIPRDRGAIWAHPVIANQTLFIRDQDLLFAFEIKR